MARRAAPVFMDGHGYEDDGSDRARLFARIFGIAFLLVGIAGFIPGITTNFDDLGFMSDSSDAEIFGLFQTSILHNLVHLIFGVAGLAMSRRADRARSYLLGAGVIYVVLFVYGLFVGGREDEKWINFIPVNNEDDVLHLLLGVGLLVAYFASRRRTSGEPAEPRRVAAPARQTTVSQVDRDHHVADEPIRRDPAEEPRVADRTDAGPTRTPRQ